MHTEIRISPVNQEMSEAAKNIVRMLCAKRPWDGNKGYMKHKLPAEYVGSYEELRCLPDINYKYELRIGTLEADVGGGGPISGIEQIGEDVYLHLIPELCEFIFVKGFPEFFRQK